MARGTLSVQQVVSSGLNATYTAADAINGHEFVNGGRAILHVVNAGTGATTVTIATDKTLDGLVLPARTVSVPAGGERFIGPFAPDIYNQSGQVVYVDFDVDTSVTLAALRV